MNKNDLEILNIIIVQGDAYSIKGYDKNTGIVDISAYWRGRVIIKIHIDELMNDINQIEGMYI